MKEFVVVILVIMVCDNGGVGSGIGDGDDCCFILQTCFMFLNLFSFKSVVSYCQKN